MTREGTSVGLAGIVLGMLRAHVAESVLCVLAAALWVSGVVIPPESPLGTRAFPRETRAKDVDATLVSALLEIRDGEWVVREGSVVAVPTLGRDEVEVEHVGRGGLLFPLAKQAWTAGGPLLRWSVPEWRIDMRYRIVRRDGIPAVGVEDSSVEVRGWGFSPFSGVSEIDRPAIPTGFDPLGRAMTYAPEEGGFLHVAVLSSETASDFTSVDSWRALVARHVDALAQAAAFERDPGERLAWWQSHDSEVTTAATLAAVLRIPECARSLRALRADLDREFTRRNFGRYFPPLAADVLGGALGLLDRERATDPEPPTAIVDRFASGRVVLGWLAIVYADTPAAPKLAQLLGHTDVWRAKEPYLQSPFPLRSGWILPLLFLVIIIAQIAAGGTTRLRRRDALAVLVAYLFASLGPAPVPHVTLESVGLLVLVALLLRLRQRGAIDVPAGVPGLLALSACLLPLASVLHVSPIDAAARAAAFVAIAYLAAASLVPHAADSGTPRRPARKRDILWTSFQVLVVTGSVLALVMALIDPSAWGTRPPRPKWILVALGLLLAFVAGMLAFLRGSPPRPQPAVACAIALGAAAHLATIAMSLFATERLSGASEIGAIGAAASGAAALFVVLRLAYGRSRSIQPGTDSARSTTTPLSNAATRR